MADYDQGVSQAAPTSQDKYERMQNTNSTSIDPVKENEIRLTSNGNMSNYIDYALNLLEGKQLETIVVKAMGRVINKAVACAEIVKRRYKSDLHQFTTIGSIEIKDVFEPKQEGLDRQELTRHISTIEIQLSVKPGDPNASGYQAPIPADEHRETNRFRGSHRGRSGRGRGQRGRGQWQSRGRGGGGPRAENIIVADAPASGGGGPRGENLSAAEAPASSQTAPSDDAGPQPLPPHRGNGSPYRGFRGFRGGRGNTMGRGGHWAGSGGFHPSAQNGDGERGRGRGRGERGGRGGGRWRGGRGAARRGEHDGEEQR